MATSAQASPAVRQALESLVDYAGLFPPAQLDMRAAVQEYAEVRRGPHAWMLGRFIVPESRMGELAHESCGSSSSERLAASVIVDAGTDARAWLPNVQTALGRIAAGTPEINVEMLEVPLPNLLSARETYDAPIGQFAAAAEKAGLRVLPVFVELPRDERWPEALSGAFAALRRHRFGAKLRCGGATAEAVPSSADVAVFITEAREAGIPFKATAGLHHPIRNAEMHGFLNLLAATALSLEGATRGELIAALEDRDRKHFTFEEDAFRWDRRLFSRARLADVREHGFVSYGSCSFSEPVEDLHALDMIQ